MKALDQKRELDPQWFHSNLMLGGVCYVDLFAGNLSGVRSRIPYFKELGLTYLHLMPLFRAPEPENDGGYAISSYREVAPALGTIQQLADLAADLRQNGISLVRGLRLQPHLRRARMGHEGQGRRPGIPGLLHDVPRPPDAGRL